MTNQNFSESPKNPADDPGTDPASNDVSPRKSKRAKIYSGFGGFLLFMLAVALFFFYNFKTVEVSGESMEPTLRSGSKLLITKAYWLVGPIVPDDIVVIKNDVDDDLIIKRVYKTEGQEVDPKNVPLSYSLTDGPYIVPKGTVYVLGDNYNFSQDSRDFGPFNVEDVVGKVVVVQPAFGESAQGARE